MRATIKDVANKSGVSVATVSHVINGTRFVSEDTINKVRQAMKEMDFVPSSVARSLRTNKMKTVGLLIPDISNFFFTEVAEAVDYVLSGKGYSLMLCNTGENLALEKKHIINMTSQLVSGIIIAPTCAEHDYRGMFQDSEYPIVFIDRKTTAEQADLVVVDGGSATFEAVSALIEKGCKRIGYIKGIKGLSTTSERFDGYLSALRAGGLEPDYSLIKEGNSKRESGYNLTEELIRTDADAIYVSNNLMAVGAMQCLTDYKIKVPGKIAIIGFDDYNWATITNPPLSTIRQPADALGTTAAELLLDRIENPRSTYKEVKLKAELIIRKSC